MGLLNPLGMPLSESTTVPGMTTPSATVAAQNFEYKISNILDKPTESFFGYISVLVWSIPV